MKAYQTLIASVGLAVVVSTAAMAQLLVADKLQPIDPILDVQPLELRDDFVLCGGSNGSGPSAYYNKGTDLSGRLGNVVGKDVVQMEGGTITCANALAEGRADAAIMQNDIVPVLIATNSPLVTEITFAGSVLTEAVMVMCSRNGPTKNQDSYGNIGQKKKFTIAIAGTKGSGTNITLNSIALQDKGYSRPLFSYGGSWEGALDAVVNGTAACAIGVSSPTAEMWEKLDDKYGAKVRMIGVHDSDFWDVKGLGGAQIYGEMKIDKKSDLLDDLLSWKGAGKKMWSPETVGLEAGVYFRTDAIKDSQRTAFADAVKSQASLIALDR